MNKNGFGGAPTKNLALLAHEKGSLVVQAPSSFGLLAAAAARKSLTVGIHGEVPKVASSFWRTPHPRHVGAQTGNQQWVPCFWGDAGCRSAGFVCAKS